jgi:tripartite ATP-independent transporter DctP family solute receptor
MLAGIRRAIKQAHPKARKSLGLIIIIGRKRMSHWTRRITLGATLVIAAAGIAAPASAQTKLKWAHVYEVAEPYHTEALWAADEIKKRTSGRYEIGVFPASQLGNENQINEALGLGTVDMIYTGVAFAGSIHKPIAITNAPFVLRDFDHFMAYRASPLFRTIAKGYEDKTKHKVITLTYYGQRMVTANKEIKKPEDMKGMKLRVPPAPLFLMFTKSVGANATPIAFAEVYLALQQKTVDGQENPLPTIMAKKFYEVQSHIMLTGHITESLLTIVGSHVWPKLSDADKKIFEEVLSEAALKATKQIRDSEQKTADELRKLGKTVVEVDRAAFRAAALPLHNDGSGGWSQAEYDALQALK